jgi:hypothetical protein
VAAARFFKDTPEHLPGRGIRLSPRQAFATAAVAAVLASAYLGPIRLAHRGGDYMRSLRPDLPTLDQPSLVFVHDGWNNRIIGRLASAGLPLYEIEAVLVGNDICTLQEVLDSTSTRDGVWSRLPDRSQGPDLVDLKVYPGQNTLFYPSRFDAGGMLRLPPHCVRQLSSDRHGVVPLAPFLWRGGLPGLDDRTVYVRDLGPERNEPMIARYPHRPHYYMVRDGDDGPPRLVRYNEGTRLLWNGSSESDRSPEVGS